MKSLQQNHTFETSAFSPQSAGGLAGFAFLASTLVVAVFDFVVIALHSPPLTDDLMARISAQSTSIGHMLTLLRVQPVNVDAPVFPVLAFLSARLPLPIGIAIAVPSICGFCAAIVATFLLVRDWLGTSAGCLAIVMLTLTQYTSFGARPRPYALLLGGMAVSVLCWARATGTSRHRRLWLIGFCISTTLTLLTHYFAVFSIAGVVLAELVRSLRQKKIDWPVWTALAVSALIFLPLYAIFSPGGEPYRAHPFDGVHLPDLVNTYKELLKFPQLLVITATASAIVMALGRPKYFRKLSAGELVLAVTLSLGPVFVFATGVFYSHTYVARYGICALLGVAILVAGLGTFIAGGAARAILPGVFIVFLIHQVRFIRIAQTPVYSPQSSWPASEPEVLRQNAELPLMTPDFDYAMRVHFYAPAWLSSRLLMVGSRQSMLRFMGTDAPTLAMLAVHRWTGWPMADYEPFIRDHKLFLMYGQYWAIEALKSAGAGVEQLQDLGPYHLYLVTLR